MTATDTLTTWRASLVTQLDDANALVTTTTAAKTAADDARDAMVALRDDVDLDLATLTEPASAAMMDLYSTGLSNDTNAAINAATAADAAAQAALNSVVDITLGISQIDLMLAP